MPRKFNDWAAFGFTEEGWKALTKVERYRIRYPDRVAASQKKFAEENKQYMSDRQRKYQLRHKYGITEDDYERMMLEQDGKCAICNRTEPTGRWKRLAVDHCHKTGKVRGLLCDKCNRGMGLLEDSAQLLRNAANYLEKYKDDSTISGI